MTQELTAIFSKDSVAASHAWALIAKELEYQNLAEEVYILGGEEIPLREIPSTLSSKYHRHFNINGKLLEFDLTSVGAYAHDALRVRANVETDWDSWVGAIRSAGHFVQAYAVDVDYDYWQNASDPLQYTAKDVPFEHLPMTSNGLPYPLDRQVIDVSKNPGRRILREGFIEAIGSPMWLSEEFFELAGSSPDDALISHGGVTTSRDGPLIRIEFKSGAISDSSDDEASVYLRGKLFPNRNI